ncbi:MAG: PLP-dependent aminotransferase family protein [Frankiaceae bacterium]
MPFDLHVSQLHGSLADPVMRSMQFLNEVSSRYPDAVSFAAGRPTEAFLDGDALPRYIDRFRQHLRVECRMSDEAVRTALFQYGPTKGLIRDLLVRYLWVDEGIVADPEAVVVTVGCQEAMFLVLRAFRSGPEDVLLAVAPTYVGLTGAARLLDLPVWPVPAGELGVDLEALRGAVRLARAAGRRPVACYVMPDFANPLGVSMPVEARRALLDLAREEGLLLLEDNPYGLFGAGESRPPTLKALDADAQVVYLASLAKSGFPGARVGFVVADQVVRDEAGGGSLLADHLAAVKSMVTVNTSTLGQAALGGKLLEHGCSLLAANRDEIELYRRNRTALLAGLARIRTEVPISWNQPNGGFFVVVTVPFPVDDGLLELSARRFGVLWTPMASFYEPPGGRCQLRLSFSALTEGDVDEGLDRLRAFIADVLTGSKVSSPALDPCLGPC